MAALCGEMSLLLPAVSLLRYMYFKLKGVKHHFVDVHNIMSFDCL